MHLIRIGAANCILIAFSADTVHSVRVSSRSCALHQRKRELSWASVETYCGRRANSKKSPFIIVCSLRIAARTLECCRIQISGKIGHYVRYLYAQLVRLLASLCYTWAATGSSVIWTQLSTMIARIISTICVGLYVGIITICRRM